MKSYYISTKGLTYESVRQSGCSGCAFDGGNDECGRPNCTPQGMTIIWKLATTKRTYVGTQVAQALCCHLVAKSQRFTVTPLPDDHWKFEVEPEAMRLMPVENTPPVAPQPPPGGWIPNEGVIPVPVGTLVDVVHRSGNVYSGAEAGKAFSYANSWDFTDSSGDIISWRLHQS